MLLYLLVAIIPTIVLFGVYLRSLTLQMENEVLQTMQQTLNQAVISIENDLDDLKRVSDYLFVSASINESMATDAGSQTVEDQIQELDLINDTLQATMESSNLSSVRLYVDDQKIYARERDRLYPFSEFYSDPRFSDVTASGEFMLTSRNTLEGQEKYVSYVRLVKDIKQVGRTLGPWRWTWIRAGSRRFWGRSTFQKMRWCTWRTPRDGAAGRWAGGPHLCPLERGLLPAQRKGSDPHGAGGLYCPAHGASRLVFGD